MVVASVTQKLELKFDIETKRLIKDLTRALKQVQVINNHFVAASEDGVTYDDNTMFKVREALHDARLSDELINDAISSLQNAGILFRERNTK